MKVKQKLRDVWVRFRNVIASPKVILLTKVMVFMTVVVAGTPMVWANIPVGYRPASFWDFFNSVLLCYIAWNVTAQRIK